MSEYQPLPGELSNYVIQQIHDGLLLANDDSRWKMWLELQRYGSHLAFRSDNDILMAREIRKYRGVPNPDLA